MIMVKGKKNTSEYMTFNGKKYRRVDAYYLTKKDVKEIAENKRKVNSENVIIDKRKEGYIIWVGLDKRKSKKKGSK